MGLDTLSGFCLKTICSARPASFFLIESSVGCSSGPVLSALLVRNVCPSAKFIFLCQDLELQRNPMKFRNSPCSYSKENHGEEIAHISSCSRAPEESRVKLSVIMETVKPSIQLQNNITKKFSGLYYSPCPSYILQTSGLMSPKASRIYTKAKTPISILQIVYVYLVLEKDSFFVSVC